MKIQCCDLCLKQNIVKVSQGHLGYPRKIVHFCKEHESEAKKLALSFKDDDDAYNTFYNSLVDIVNNL